MSLFSTKISATLGICAAILMMAGCKNKESMVPGTWSGDNITVTTKADKTFSVTQGPLTITGTWKIDADDVVFSNVTVMGKPVSEVKALLQQRAAAMPQLKAAADDIDKDSFMKLSDDGKSMTTDKAKDKNSTPSRTFTKSAS